MSDRKSKGYLDGVFNKFLLLHFSGQNVEEAFMETTKKIYQNIKDGLLDLNASESGVQQKLSQPSRNALNNDTQAQKENCSC